MTATNYFFTQGYRRSHTPGMHICIGTWVRMQGYLKGWQRSWGVRHKGILFHEEGQWDVCEHIEGDGLCST